MKCSERATVEKLNDWKAIPADYCHQLIGCCNIFCHVAYVSWYIRRNGRKQKTRNQKRAINKIISAFFPACKDAGCRFFCSWTEVDRFPSLLASSEIACERSASLDTSPIDVHRADANVPGSRLLLLARARACKKRGPVASSFPYWFTLHAREKSFALTWQQCGHLQALLFAA